MADMRTPLNRVRGLGSTKSGTSHFWAVRVTSAALFPLSLFVIGLVVSLAGSSFTEVRATLGQPLVWVPVMLFILISLEHMRLGMQEVVSDYIHSELLKVTLMMLNSFFVVLVGGICVFSLLKIAFGG
ncbi:succinate dehydrogenase, hydrophobic membrane anchor protein [Tianweitania sp.]|uniref:succinate dehydrogenase, hydrophobic membrane anchor protein n=1 Tax=Tianweitania sp. TaxID=2021634 RepID=UPI00289BD214|nr:succinate dehydrogenase, hydrophobic membrane anchor protein [Tianweitania sp.]